MAEPLKNMYSLEFLESFASRVKSVHPIFDDKTFTQLVVADGWDELELKGRIRRITESLHTVLPESYVEALDVLDKVSSTSRGFPYLFFPDFVERYGLQDWERSMQALERYTPLSSAEFAVRPFILADSERMMTQMRSWGQHPDEHVRRLASEGCRPRLPWAMALPAFKRDPSPILPILDMLKADPSEYVRRSVANNLNDISKDHPNLVLELAAKWHGASPDTDALLRHACRSLIRREADPKALALFGLSPVEDIRVTEWSVSPGTQRIGEAVEVCYALSAPEGSEAKLRLELAVDYPRRGGARLHRKLFKLTERVVQGGAGVAGTRRHSFADLSTRRHEPGLHKLSLIVNGRELASCDLMLEAGGVSLV